MYAFIYPSVYFFYRSTATVVFTIVSVQSIFSSFMEAMPVIDVIARIMLTGVLSLILWSCPDLISRKWEANLPLNVWKPKVAIISVAIVVSALFFGSFGIFALALFTIILVFPEQFQYGIVISTLTMLLTTIPMAVGLFRILLRR